jgi:HD-GYP domain-containing protein (c-di-GMP phosphodiesterase class II)
MAGARSGVRGARLMVESGPLAGTSMDLFHGLTIGRRPENNLRIPDELVSRFHACIERRGSGWWLIDLDSRTGSLVDGRLVPGRTQLEDQQLLVLGRTQLRFIDAVADPAAELRDGPAIAARPDALGKPRSDFSDEPTGPRLTLLPLDGPGALDEQGLVDPRRSGRHLKALLLANRLFSTELDLSRVFERILDALFDTYPAHRAAILVASSASDTLTVRAWRARGEPEGPEPFRLSHAITERALADRVGVLTLDAGVDARFDPRRSIIDQNIRSAICSPMVNRDEVFGVIYLDTLGVANAFGEDDLLLLNGIAAAAAGAVRNALLVSKLEATALDTVYRLAIAAEYRDDETGFHIHRMSDYAAALARALGKDTHYAELLRRAAPMHDVGKIGIPDAILKKPGKLTPEEFEVMKQHPLIGGSILANAGSELLQMAQDIALTHHERFDGTGYPRGLAGKAIPLSGRIIAVADVFDAITSRRCYKPAFALDKALAILEAESGTHFDPEIVAAFMSIQPQVVEIRDHYVLLEEQASGRGAGSAAGLRRAAELEPARDGEPERTDGIAVPDLRLKPGRRAG